MSPLRRLALRRLRRAFLALLLLGIVVRPLMGDVASMHVFEHAAASAASVKAGVAGHGHDGVEVIVAAPDHGHQHVDVETLGVGDHATGAHAVMHYGGVGASTVALQVSLQLPPLLYAEAIPIQRPAGLPRPVLSQPFRPPIA